MEGLTDSGIEAKLYNVAEADRTEVIGQMLDAKGFLIGSSTHDNDMLPNIAGFLELLKGLKPKGRCAAAFGSYGWAGGAAASIEKALQEAGAQVTMPSISCKYAPDVSEEAKCYEFGKDFAKTLR